MRTRAELLQQISSEIINHDVADDAFEWPEAARDVRTALLKARELPSWTYAGPYPRVDDGLEYLLAELHVPSAVAGGPSTTPRDEPASSFSSALRICDMVRQQRSKQSEDELFSSSYSNVLTYAVMVACGRIDQQVLLENDARMAVPRIPDASPAMHYLCEELRIPLAAAVCAGDPELFPVGHPSGFTPEDQLIAALTDRDLEADMDSGEKIWVPSSTHVFHRWRQSSMTEVCGHPFLCMASLPELRVSMSAVLHQRRTWDLPYPVIGIAFSPVSTEISFVLGWYEENPRAPTFPAIHMCDLGPQLTFDLLHPRHILSAFNAILSLRGLAQDLYIAANSRRDILRRPTCFADQWRADTFNLWFPSEDSVTKITHWLKNCAQAEDMATPLARQTLNNSQKNAAASASGAGSSRSDTGRQSLSGSQQSERPSNTTQLSASAASRKSAADDKNVLVVQWLFDRFALTASAALDEEQWGVLMEYTTIYWPDDILQFNTSRERWTLADGCGIALSPDELSLFEMMFTTLATFKASHPDLVKTISLSRNKDNSEDAADLGSHFLKALPLILETFSLLRSISSNANPKDLINEATWRTPIDNLLMNLFGDKKHAVRENLTGWTTDESKLTGSKVKADGGNRLERTLQLPSSYAYHRILPQSTVARKRWTGALYDLATPRSYDQDEILERVKRLLVCNCDGLEYETGPVGPERFDAVGEKMRKAIEEKMADVESKAQQIEEECGAFVRNRVFAWRNQVEEVSVLRRASAMSSAAVVDAMAYLRVPVSIPKDQLDSFALAKTSSSADQDSTSHPSADAAASKEASVSVTSGTAQKQQEGHSPTAQAPSSQKSPDKPTKETIGSAFPSSKYSPDIKVDGLDDIEDRNPALKDNQNYLHLPVLVQEWKKLDGDVHQAVNQQTLDLVASVRFLEACGIVNFPVFGLISDGPVLQLDYAFADDKVKHSDERPVLVCNRHPTSFDLLNPMGMWRFATAIISINRLHIQKLHKKWEAAREEYKKPPPDSAPLDDPRYLHAWDSHRKQLPQWTVPQKAVRKSIRERIPQLRKDYKKKPFILSELDIIEKIVEETKTEEKERVKEEEKEKKAAK